MCYITFVRPFFFYNNFNHGLLCLPDLEIGLTTGGISQRGCHWVLVLGTSDLILLLVCQGVGVCQIFWNCISYGIYETDHISLYMNYPFIGKGIYILAQ
jgi:hypothetical protein